MTTASHRARSSRQDGAHDAPLQGGAVSRRRPLLRWFLRVIGGGVLLALGAALLVDQLGYRMPYRWAFLIILLPAAVAIVGGLRGALADGWRNLRSLSRIITGLLFAAIGTFLALGINTGIILPVLIIGLGLGSTAFALLDRARSA